MRVFLGLAVLVAFAGWNAVENRPAVPVPDQLTIHGQKWSVAVVPAMAGDYVGFTECDLHVILLLRRSPAKMAESLDHEAQHAMAPCVDGIPQNDVWINGEDRDQSSDHPWIYYGARQWTEFIADNPQAVEYIRWARTKK